MVFFKSKWEKDIERVEKLLNEGILNGVKEILIGGEILEDIRKSSRFDNVSSYWKEGMKIKEHEVGRFYQFVEAGDHKLEYIGDYITILAEPTKPKSKKELKEDMVELWKNEPGFILYKEYEHKEKLISGEIGRMYGCKIIYTD